MLLLSLSILCCSYIFLWCLSCLGSSYRMRNGFNLFFCFYYGGCMAGSLRICTPLVALYIPSGYDCLHITEKYLSLFSPSYCSWIKTSEASNGKHVVLYATVYPFYFDFVVYKFLPRLCADLYYYIACVSFVSYVNLGIISPFPISISGFCAISVSSMLSVGIPSVMLIIFSLSILGLCMCVSILAPSLSVMLFSRV